MMIHPIPSLPWSKVGTDLFELDNRHFLILVDYYSNFIEVAELERDTRAKTVITKIKECIARYGIMDILVSDNGPQFACQEFKDLQEHMGSTMSHHHHYIHNQMDLQKDQYKQSRTS